MVIIYSGAPKVKALELNLTGQHDESRNMEKIVWKKHTFSKPQLHCEIATGCSQETEEDLTSISLPLVLSDYQNENVVLQDAEQNKDPIFHQISQIFTSMDEILKGSEHSTHAAEKDGMETQVVGETPLLESTDHTQNFGSMQHLFSQEDFSHLNSLEIRELKSVKENVKTNVMVTILQKNPVKDITIKHGMSTGKSIQLASVLVGDQSDFYVTISFWREQAHWVEKLQVGDITVVTNVVFDGTKGRKIGRTTTHSVLYNFKVPKSSDYYARKGRCKMEILLNTLHSWLNQHHNYLYSPMFQESHESHELIGSSFSQINDGKLNTIQAKVIGFACDVQCLSAQSFGYIELQDETGSTMRINLTEIQWKQWIESIRENLKPTIKITSIAQRYCKISKHCELYTSQNSTLEIIKSGNRDHDYELKGYTIDFLEFYDEDGILRCRKDERNVTEKFELKPLLYKSCNHCFVSQQEGTANHNKQKQTISYCPDCGKICKCIFMFTQLQIQLKKSTPKNFGEVQPALLKALSPYVINLELFPNFFKACENVEYSEDFVGSLNDEINSIFSKRFDVTVSKLDSDEEELYMLDTTSYIIKDLQQN